MRAGRGYVFWQGRVQLWHVLALAFALRLAWACVVPVHPIADSMVYDRLAQRIASGHGYSWPGGAPTAYWPVGTSALLAVLYSAVGRSLEAAALLNAVLGTLLAAATYAIAVARFDRTVAVIAAGIIAFWPTGIAFTTILSSELPSNLAFAAGLALALSRQARPWLQTLVSTALFVLAAYFRANMLPMVGVVPALLALEARSWRLLAAQGLIAAGTAALLLAPWAARNAELFGKPVLTSNNFGVNLWIGNNPSADGGYMSPPPIGAALPTNEAAQDAAYRSEAISYIRRHPVDYVRLSVNRIKITFDRETYGVAWNDQGLAPAAKAPVKVLATGYWLVLLLAGVAGALHFVWRSPQRIADPLIVTGAVIVAPAILVMASERFHYGLVPMLAIFAGYLVTRLAGRTDPGGRDHADGR